MRARDFGNMLKWSIMLGVIASVVAYFIWKDFYESIHNSFWYSCGILSVVSLPIGYFAAKSESTCPSCKTPFAITENGQTDIGHHVKARTESKTINGQKVEKQVLYNVRKYWQHMRCEHCGHEHKYETQSETRA